MFTIKKLIKLQDNSQQEQKQGNMQKGETMPKPKFEKVDAHTIRIVVERAEDVSLAKLVENRVKLLEQKKNIEQTLKNLDEILEAGKKLGIVAKKQPSAQGKPTQIKLAEREKK